jgi:prepilin-type N-terminal cleavage/methylation domain-containing protein
MSASCRSRQPMSRPEKERNAATGERGFTLLEIVIVLVIVAMTGAIVFPRLTTMAASFEFASQRDSFEQALNGLSYKTYRENDDKILQGSYTDAGRAEAAKQPRRDPGTILPPEMRTRSLLAESREHLPPVVTNYAALPLPQGWEMVIAEPIYFRGSGYCSGGTVELFVGRLQYSYRLRPPLCRAELME